MFQANAQTAVKAATYIFLKTTDPNATITYDSSSNTFSANEYSVPISEIKPERSTKIASPRPGLYLNISPDLTFRIDNEYKDDPINQEYQAMGNATLARTGFTPRRLFREKHERRLRAHRFLFDQDQFTDNVDQLVSMYHEKLNPIEEHVHKLDVDEVSMFYLDRHMPAMDSIALGNKKLYYCDKGRTAIIATALAGLAALTYAIPQAREAAISVYQWYQFCSDYSQTAPYLTRLGLRTIANIPLTSAFFGTGDIFAQYITKGKVDDIERLKKTFAMGVYNGIEFTLLYAGINALFNFDYGLPEIANKAVNSAGMVAIDPYAYLWVAHARHVDWMSKKEADLKLSDLLKWWSPSINIRETKRLFKQKDFKEKWDGVTSYARKFWTKFHFINRTFTPERYQILPTWVAVIPFTIYLALQSNKTAGPAKLRDTILDSIEKQTPS